jgi:integrase
VRTPAPICRGTWAGAPTTSWTRSRWVALLGLLGLRVFEACNSTIDDLGEEHGHRILRVLGKGTKLTLIPLPPAVGRAIDRAVGDRVHGPILLNRNGNPMDRHAATRRLPRLASAAGRADDRTYIQERAGRRPPGRGLTKCL